MKNELILDYTLLNDYDSFNNANVGNWNILNYINYKYELNTAVAFAKFFMPDFIEKKGCLILDFLYNETIFDKWYMQLDGDKVKIEKICNLYELRDFFHINSGELELINIPKLDFLSKSLKLSWQLMLDNLYGSNMYEVITFEDNNSLFITLHSIN